MARRQRAAAAAAGGNDAAAALAPQQQVPVVGVGADILSAGELPHQQPWQQQQQQQQQGLAPVLQAGQARAHQVGSTADDSSTAVDDEAELDELLASGALDHLLGQTGSTQQQQQQQQGEGALRQGVEQQQQQQQQQQEEETRVKLQETGDGQQQLLQLQQGQLAGQEPAAESAGQLNSPYCRAKQVELHTAAAGQAVGQQQQQAMHGRSASRGSVVKLPSSPVVGSARVAEAASQQAAAGSKSPGCGCSVDAAVFAVVAPAALVPAAAEEQ
jgi:hypothetical protein